MKKFLMTFMIAAMALITQVALSSCDNTREYFTPKVESAQVKMCIDSIVNPVFTSVDDVFELQKTLRTNAFIDSVFISIPEPTLKNVSSVVLKKLHHVTKDDIVGEFLNNRQVYENLPPPEASNAIPSTNPTIPNADVSVKETGQTAMEVPSTRVEDKRVANTSYQYKDTTIDGKSADIVTKITTYE